MSRLRRWVGQARTVPGGVPPLLWFLALLGAMWGLLQFHDSPLPPDIDPLDITILVLVAASYALGVVVMLIGTRRWGARSVALLATWAGDATLYGGGVYARLFGLQRTDEWWTDFTRSLFVIGGSLLVFCYLRWGVSFWRGEEHKQQEPPL